MSVVMIHPHLRLLTRSAGTRVYGFAFTYFGLIRRTG